MALQPNFSYTFHSPRIQNYQAKLLQAASKDEAISCAIGAAENLMKALKLCADPKEKQDLRSQVKVIIEAADGIKKSDQWRPPAQRSSATPDPATKIDDIDQWAAAVAESTNGTVADGNLGSDEPEPLVAASKARVDLVDVSHNSAPSQGATPLPFQVNGLYATNAPPPPKKTHNANNLGPNGAAEAQTNDAFSCLIAMHRSPATRQPTIPPQSIANPDPASSFVANTSPDPLSVSKMKTSPPFYEDNTAHVRAAVSHGSATVRSTPQPRTQVRRLKVPVSTRTQAKKEKILLLRSSAVNGFKFPPWDKDPATSEFTLELGGDLFT
jgi:calpain-7